MNAIECLVSLPAASSESFAQVDPERAANIFVASDPPGRQLGSGGGTVALLHNAFSASGVSSFGRWLSSRPKLMIHGSGQSRRLPAYAGPGKPLMPLPLNNRASGQGVDPCLLDIQRTQFERLLWPAPEQFRLLVGCGDTLLQSDGFMPPFPDADVIIFGLTASAEEASHHGVMFCSRQTPQDLELFLQKPTPEKIRSLEQQYVFSLDTGAWLLSSRAVNVLMRKCGWDHVKQEFEGGEIKPYELFGEFGPGLGAKPAVDDAEVNSLRCAVVPVPEGRFYHFGTNRSVLTSVREWRNPRNQRRSFGHGSGDEPGEQCVLHSVVASKAVTHASACWIENAYVPETWNLNSHHAITHIPDNRWGLTLESGVCLDMPPVGEESWVVRCYGFDDESKGGIADERTMWLGAAASSWFDKRGITLEEASIDGAIDIQACPIFPLCSKEELSGEWISWLSSRNPPENQTFARKWLQATRLSASDILRKINLARLNQMRNARTVQGLRSELLDSLEDLCEKRDLRQVARWSERYKLDPAPPPSAADVLKPLSVPHDRMFRSILARGDEAAHQNESAFNELQKLIVSRMAMDPVHPRRDVLDDQIVWARSPARVDLAGGWTDTPPYCIQHGGSVLNMAVNLNGQPPIQVFGRCCEKPHIVIRSIDIGVEETVRTYEELQQYRVLGSGFSIAKAALALCGFDPQFGKGHAYASLENQLQESFGGGIEISLLAAIPKGSGLGTSSILAATLLGMLNDLCGLHWTKSDLFARTSALEQLLTSGGGWQDQVGGVLGGVKLIQTQPGLRQEPVVRWLPEQLLGEERLNRTVLLYYTGVTRVAKNILGEIVRNMFLNESGVLDTLTEIGVNAHFAADAFQRNDWPAVCESVNRAWVLNQRLDAGTNPPQVQAILSEVGDYLDAVKLPGAGGGGYILMVAKDKEAGLRARNTLEARPPNAGARFVDLSLGTRGLVVTRS